MNDLSYTIQISKAITRQGEDPLRYLLALKYIDALKKIASMERTKVRALVGIYCMRFTNG